MPVNPADDSNGRLPSEVLYNMAFAETNGQLHEDTEAFAETNDELPTDPADVPDDIPSADPNSAELNVVPADGPNRRITADMLFADTNGELSDGSRGTTMSDETNQLNLLEFASPIEPPVDPALMARAERLADEFPDSSGTQIELDEAEEGRDVAISNLEGYHLQVRDVLIQVHLLSDDTMVVPSTRSLLRIVQDHIMHYPCLGAPLHARMILDHFQNDECRYKAQDHFGMDLPEELRVTRNTVFFRDINWRDAAQQHDYDRFHLLKDERVPQLAGFPEIHGPLINDILFVIRMDSHEGYIRNHPKIHEMIASIIDTIGAHETFMQVADRIRIMISENIAREARIYNLRDQNIPLETDPDPIRQIADDVLILAELITDDGYLEDTPQFYGYILSTLNSGPTIGEIANGGTTYRDVVESAMAHAERSTRNELHYLANKAGETSSPEK